MTKWLKSAKKRRWSRKFSSGRTIRLWRLRHQRRRRRNNSKAWKSRSLSRLTLRLPVNTVWLQSRLGRRASSLAAKMDTTILMKAAIRSSIMWPLMRWIWAIVPSVPYHLIPLSSNLQTSPPRKSSIRQNSNSLRARHWNTRLRSQLRRLNLRGKRLLRTCLKSFFSSRMHRVT